MFFHMIDSYDLFPQYRLHTPAEVLKRNHVSRYEVFKDVIIQQAVQTAFGISLSYFDPVPLTGKDDYNVAVWAQRIRIAQRSIPTILGFLGVDAQGVANNVAATYPILAGALSGGKYPWLRELAVVGDHKQVVPAFAGWEMLVAKALYWVVIPAIQFIIGIIIVDTWQYFLHRAMHMNKYLYTKFHSRHHRLYVPYAYGALYNHPFEGFLLDTLGTGLAYLLTGMTQRQSMWFFTFSTVKTVDDHCGYAFPWDPLQFITDNNAEYHDIHHQSWGIKTNFSQPFFTFWDRILGTKWVGGDVSGRYEKSRVAAQQKVDRDATLLAEITKADANKPDSETSESLETDETSRASTTQRRTQKRKVSSAAQQTGNLKGLRNRVNESLQGKGVNVLGVESGH
jgi:sphinganine C4-monooxygenase